VIAFYLDRGCGVATYLQLVQQVRHALRLGVLSPGDRLPTASEVVTQLGINPNTVFKAYRELEREGLVEARPGQGTFVRRTLGGGGTAAHGALRRELTRSVQAARKAGLDLEDIQAVFTSVLQASTRKTVA